METKPFGTVVRDLLIAQGITTQLGNPNWAEFAMMLDDVGYETLRKAVTGERHPGEKVMEAVAEALDVEPDMFFEYNLLQAQRSFDPREVGADDALANLLAWKRAQGKGSESRATRPRGSLSTQVA
jgi:transcriptional regulator with XRE-family HTH domain